MTSRSLLQARDRATPADLPNLCAAAVLDTVPSIMDALRGAMRRHVGDQLSVPQFRCLNFIAREPGSSISSVAAFMGVTMPTASALVERLARAGAVQAQPDPTDRRRSRLLITTAGQAQLSNILNSTRDDLALMLAQRHATELQDLLQGLEVMGQAFAAHSSPVPAALLRKASEHPAPH